MLLLYAERVSSLQTSSKLAEAAELADEGIERLKLRVEADGHNLETKRDLAVMLQRRGNVEMALSSPSTALSFLFNTIITP